MYGKISQDIALGEFIVGCASRPILTRKQEGHLSQEDEPS